MSQKAARTAILVAALASLGDIDITAMFDHSLSMTTMMKKPGAESGGALTSRAAVLEGLGLSIVQDMVPYDSNGIDVINFGRDYNIINGVTPENFAAAYKKGESLDRKGTNLAGALKAAFELCLGRISQKKQAIICFTDGQPSDADQVVQTITQYSDDGRTVVGSIGLCFVQIADADGVAEFLTMLDKALKCKNDITGRTTIDAFAQIDIGHKLGYTLAGSHDPAEYEAVAA
jgi:hypothetical protein